MHATGLLVMLAGISEAQQVMTIDDRLACSRCRIVLDTVTTIGSASGTDMFAAGADVMMDVAGNVLLTDPWSYPGQVLYRPSGTTDWVIMGRLGEGPGELMYPSYKWTSPEGVHVFDMRNRRETVFDTAGNLISTYRLPGTPSAIVELSDGNRLYASVVRTPTAAGYPLHILDKNREIIRSFGVDIPVLLPGSERLLVRRAAPARDGGFWTVSVNEYVIEKWSRSGEKLLTIRRAAHWFEPWFEQQNTYREPTKPAITGIAEDSDGLLWITMNVADKNFKPLIAEDYHGPIDEDVRRRAIDTRIEVLDPTRGVLLTRGRSDNALRSSVGFGLRLLGETKQAEDGTLRYVVFRMRLALTRDGR